MLGAPKADKEWVGRWPKYLIHISLLLRNCQNHHHSNIVILIFYSRENRGRRPAFIYMPPHSGINLHGRQTTQKTKQIFPKATALAVSNRRAIHAPTCKTTIVPSMLWRVGNTSGHSGLVVPYVWLLSRASFFYIFLVGPICHSFKWQLPEMTYHLHSLPISQLGKVRAPAFIYGPQGSAAFCISSSWFSFFVDLRWVRMDFDWVMEFLRGMVKPVAALAVVLMAVALSYFQKLGLEGEMVYSILRAFLQLSVIGFVLQFIFTQANSGWILLVYFFMVRFLLLFTVHIYFPCSLFQKF